MAMNNKLTDTEIEQLADRYKKGTLSAGEKAKFDQWYASFEDTTFAHSGSNNPANVRERIYSGLLERMGYVAVSPKVRLWPRFVAAASIAIALMAGGFYYYQSKIVDRQSAMVNNNDIAPGKDGATLTLADGRKILINDALAGNIASENGVQISKDKNGLITYVISSELGDEKSVANGTSFNTLTTTRGEQTRVRLPDGTLVFLNAESTLKYPTTFARQPKREVALAGEGYFEVAKDKAHPFIVNSEQQAVEVLGTHFNVNTYAPMGIKTTLLEGSVKVSSLTSRSSHLLKPNQQAVLSRTGIQITDVEAEYETAWKDGFFMFNNEPLGEIMEKVARWYNVKVVYEDESLKKEEFLGTISKFENISKVLEMLQETQLVTFSIDKNTLKIKRRPK